MSIHSGPLCPEDNRLIAGFTKAERELLQPHWQEVALHQGQVLHAEGEKPARVHFLTRGLATQTISTDTGKELSLFLVGGEGMLGDRALFEGGFKIGRCAMLTDGHAFTLAPSLFNEEFQLGGKLHDMVLRFLEARIAEMARTALCNQMHSLEHRLSRWLLTAADRLRDSDIPVTHEVIAQMLGTRRSGITIVLGELRAAKLIEYSRGHILIANRKGLEAQTCECYEAIKQALEHAYHPRHASS